MSRPRLIGLLLALITLLAYWPVAQNNFVVYDDGEYVTGNPMVLNGLTWAGIKWAFTTGHASNWHPLTWLSHMTDCELFGPNPGAHHAINLLWHTANTVLLFVLLLRLTNRRPESRSATSSPPADALWPSAFVAALFAWHPLHVESVAWVSERKDVLSTFFALLTLLAYVTAASRVTHHASHFSIPTLIFFALGLMAKPMLVTLPFVMLLLDYWPLGRISEFGIRNSESKTTIVPASQLATFSRLLFEKWPCFFLATVSCVITYLAQRHGEAVMTIQQLSLNLRIENALISYERYLAKAFWPAGLAVFYPLTIHLAWYRAMAAAALGLLGGISWLAWRVRQRYPYLLVGWFWFLGTLVPVIGLVQVGSAAMADRYTYFPLIGVFIAVGFGGRDLANRFKIPKTVVAAAAALILGSCLVLTGKQARYWYDSETLFAHTLAVTQDNYNARINYGVALDEKGRLTDALIQYQEAERLSPENAQAHYNIGGLLNKMGRPEEALPEQQQAVQLNPAKPLPHNSLGIVFTELGRFDEAEKEFRETERLDPAYPWAHFEMAKLRLKQGRDAEAIDEFREAVRLDPNNYQILTFVARVLATDENPKGRDGKSALALAAKANALTGGSQPLVLDALGMACAEAGDFTNALELTQRAFDIATAGNMKKLEPLQQRLEFYKNHQPWRESFLFTNSPPAEPPKR